ncbi:MAG: hypothetical protein JJ975_11920 [Bacteroidia bacterium]|nr:hypothetical protein [Bacteroidia bacterium]
MRPYKGYIIDHPGFKTLYENTVMIVGHVFENSYCINKLTKEEFAVFQFENDPTCGVVGRNNDWCLIGGEVLMLKTWKDNTLRSISQIKEVFDLKSVDDYNVQILTDPWSEKAAIWELKIDLNRLSNPVSVKKLRDFTEFRNKPYTKNINW